jgi:hypothetical protein
VIYTVSYIFFSTKSSSHDNHFVLDESQDTARDVGSTWQASLLDMATVAHNWYSFFGHRLVVHIMSTHAIDDYNLEHPSRPPHHIFLSMLLGPCLAPPCPFSPSRSLVSPSLCPRKCRSHSILIRYDTTTYLSSIASSKLYRIIHDKMSIIGSISWLY